VLDAAEDDRQVVAPEVRCGAFEAVRVLGDRGGVGVPCGLVDLVEGRRAGRPAAGAGS
jgi:hypothetical protein